MLNYWPTAPLISCNGVESHKSVKPNDFFITTLCAAQCSDKTQVRFHSSFNFPQVTFSFALTAPSNAPVFSSRQGSRNVTGVAPEIRCKIFALL